jgi:hypothetical protein
MPLINHKNWTITFHPGEDEKDLNSSLRIARIFWRLHPWQIVKEAQQQNRVPSSDPDGCLF